MYHLTVNLIIQSHRIPMNYLLVNLAVADISYATFHTTELIYRHITTHPDGFTGKIVCLLRNGALQWIGASSSIFTLVAIAFERYFAVLFPYANKGKLTLCKLKVWHYIHLNVFSTRLNFQGRINFNLTGNFYTNHPLAKYWINIIKRNCAVNWITTAQNWLY